MPSPTKEPRERVRPRFKVVAYDLSAGRAVKVAEAVGDAYHFGVGAEQGDRLSIYHSVAGDPESLRDIAQIIADHPTGTEP